LILVFTFWGNGWLYEDYNHSPSLVGAWFLS